MQCLQRRANCTIKTVFADFVIISTLSFLWLGKLEVELKPDVDKPALRKTESRSETYYVLVARLPAMDVPCSLH